MRITLVFISLFLAACGGSEGIRTSDIKDQNALQKLLKTYPEEQSALIPYAPLPTLTQEGVNIGVKTFPLTFLDALEAKGLVKQRFPKLEVQAFLDPPALAIQGDEENLQGVSDVLKSLDQPALKNKAVIFYTPRHQKPEYILARLDGLSSGMNLIESAVSAQGQVVITLPLPEREKVHRLLPLLDQQGIESREVFSYRLKNSRAQKIAETLKAHVHQHGPSPISIIPHEAREELIITATPAEYGHIRPLIARLDAPESSVLIEASVVEVQLTDALAYGVEWFLKGTGFGALSDVAVDLNPLSGGGGLELGVVSLSSNTFAILNALGQISDVNILSRPRVMVKNESTAILRAVEEIRILSAVDVTSRQIQGTNVTEAEFESREYGVTLQVSPRIDPHGEMILTVRVVDSRRGPDDTTTGTTQPTFDKRELSTDLKLRSGETIMIGGLIQTRSQKTDRRIPVLADLPVLGAAFRSEAQVEEKTELVIFITPTVVTSASPAQRVAEVFKNTGI